MLLGVLHFPKSILRQYVMQNLGGKQSVLWAIGKKSMVYFTLHQPFPPPPLDKYYIVRWIYYTMRQVLQSAMIIRTMIANVHSYYYTIKF